MMMDTAPSRVPKLRCQRSSTGTLKDTIGLGSSMWISMASSGSSRHLELGYLRRFGR